MKINEEVLVAYFQCKLKAFFLLNAKKKKKPHDFILEINRRRKINLKKNESIIKDNLSTKLINIKQTKLGKQLVYKELLSTIDFLVEIESKSKIKDFNIEPIYFLGTNKPSHGNKIHLAFTGYILSKLYEINIRYGKLILFNGSSKKINLSNYYKKIEEVLSEFEGWINLKTKRPLLILAVYQK